MAKRILKPLTYTGLFDEVFDLYKRHFILLFSISVIVTVPYFLLYFGAYSRPFWVFWVATPLLMIELYAITYAVSCSYLGKRVGVFGAYRYVLANPLALFLTVVMASVLPYIGILLCIIPGIILMFWIAFVAPVYVVENLKYVDAIKRSRQLAAGHWGRMFVVMITAFVGTWIAAYILRLPVTVLMGDSYSFSHIPKHTPGLVNYAVVSALTSPVTTIALVLLYYDIRVRKEGFDIEMLARDLGETPEKANA